MLVKQSQKVSECAIVTHAEPGPVMSAQTSSEEHTKSAWQKSVRAPGVTPQKDVPSGLRSQ